MPCSGTLGSGADKELKGFIRRGSCFRNCGKQNVLRKAKRERKQSKSWISRIQSIIVIGRKKENK